MGESFPTELLEHIFSFCVDWLHGDRPSASTWDSKYSVDAWLAPRRPLHPLAFTEVCRRWHAVARGSSRLWSVVDLSDAALTHHSLFNTFRPDNHLTPLEIVSDAESSSKVSLSHIHNTFKSIHACLYGSLDDDSNSQSLLVSKIDVSLYPIVLASLLAHLTCPSFRTDFRLLTKLILRVPPMTMFKPTSINLVLPSSASGFTTPEQADSTLKHLDGRDHITGPSLPFTSIEIPSVRHLELDGVPVCWSSLQRLVHFSVRSLGPDGCAPTLEELRGIMDRSKADMIICRLENVALSPDDGMMTTTGAIEQQEQHRAAIVMENLESLSLSLAPPTIAALMALLIVPPPTQIQLFTSLRDDLHSILPPWFHIPSNASTLRLTRFSALFQDPYANQVTSSTSEWELDNPAFSISSASTSPIPLRILDSLSYPTQYPIFRTGVVYASASLTSLILGVGVLMDIPPSSLRSFMVHGAVNLEELRVGYQHDLQGLFDSLLHPGPNRAAPNDMEVDGPQASTQAAIPCPKLRLVSFNKPTDRWWNFGMLWLDAVVHFVSKRESVKVEMWRCHGVSVPTVKAACARAGREGPTGCEGRIKAVG